LFKDRQFSELRLDLSSLLAVVDVRDLNLCEIATAFVEHRRNFALGDEEAATAFVLLTGTTDVKNRQLVQAGIRAVRPSLVRVAQPALTS
jgi:hypothetical protein